MTILFIYFPKDIDMYVQWSGDQLGPPVEIVTCLKALMNYFQLKKLDLLWKSQYYACLL